MSYPNPQEMQTDNFAGFNYVNLMERVDKKQPNTHYRFKICLIGDGGTGKTTFINKVLNGDFMPKYVATVGAVTKQLTLNIGDGSTVTYEVWDTAGQEKNVGLRDGYYIGAIAGFFFFDITSRETSVNIPNYINAFVNASGTPSPKIFVLANKVDLLKGKGQTKNIYEKTKFGKIDMELVHISAKTNFNFVLPFEKLTKYLFNDPGLIIAADIDFRPLECNYDIFAGATESNIDTSAVDLVPDDFN